MRDWTGRRIKLRQECRARQSQDFSDIILVLEGQSSVLSFQMNKASGVTNMIEHKTRSIVPIPALSTVNTHMYVISPR